MTRSLYHHFSQSPEADYPVKDMTFGLTAFCTSADPKREESCRMMTVLPAGG